jgi:hypothetical protein
MKKEQLQGAALMIGSLYWEDEHHAPGPELGRAKRLWREALDLDRKAYLEVPIRYGMRSARRWHTYTMVFSHSASGGLAIWAPFRRPVASPREFLAQARQLGRAEGYAENDNPEPLYCPWGLVSVHWHPQYRKDRHPLVLAWREAFADFSFAGQYAVTGEPACINTYGELNLDLSMPEGIDYFLATPNVPNISAYPSAREIARAIQDSPGGYDTYLRKNLEHGIRAPGDEAAMALWEAH